jgi:hypothetical protein
MEAILLLTLSITVMYLVIKVVITKYLEKNNIVLKNLVQDGIVVSISTFSMLYAYMNNEATIKDFFSVVTNSPVVSNENVQVFTGTPEF